MERPLPPDSPFLAHHIDPYYWHFPDNWPVEGLRWYGLCYFLIFVSGILWVKKAARRVGLAFSYKDASNLVCATALGGLLGGRVGYFLLYAPADFWGKPLQILRFWEGGLSAHAGFLGGVVGLYVYAKKQNLPLLPALDLVAAIAPWGIFLGRVGNFLNGELYGTTSTLPWALHFFSPSGWTGPSHPSQLYEALLEGLLLLIYGQIRLWAFQAPRSGRLFGELLLGYSLLRIFCEIFRMADAPLILGLTRGTFYSILLFLSGTLFLWQLKQHHARGPS